jgi:hypothetical protein
MRLARISRVAFLAAVAVAVGACENSPTGPDYDPMIDPADFVTAVTNPFFPLVPGTTYNFEGETDDGTETVVVEVLHETRVILGITATVVRDRVFVDGELIEDTFDWFAQDNEGNVWYLGEDSKEIENGVVVSTEGSWESGVDGAQPGIIMWGDPAAHLGEEYRQEFYEGEAEDWGKVVAMGQSVDVPHGSFTGCIKTEDWSGLEPGSLENKYYCPGIGTTLEVKVGGGERVELIDVNP